jgi:predicted CopG family antitoxin
MRRITISVTDDMHRALRLLSILEGKSFGSVVLEALDAHLLQHGAYDLDVAKKSSSEL